jgi:hypothetical protein
MPRSYAVALCALLHIAGGCDSSQVTQPAVPEGIDRIELRAWRETLGPAYPLTITSAGSIATVLEFFAPTNAAWRDAAEFPGTPILAAFLARGDLRAEFGFVETSHQQGGFLVNRSGNRVRVRPASAADIDRFLAFFGLRVEVREPGTRPLYRDHEDPSPDGSG